MQAVEIYTTRYCPYCIRAKQLLQHKGVEYKEIAVDGDNAARQTMMQRAQGRHTVPQIFIGEAHVGGCDDLYALERAGKLDTLLAG
ncbi:glutaredoxin [Pokkaliibacter plantistimulans]|uniref:Glutaredoxin n=1 Tax=Pokkaliibacter plantistimulans TaxID=1635171 RepID=A0ABX5M3I2_9GAMM|nr:glutaredoxin 3 [Pokkaliibacter plantistimulans]PXF32238.1 glutaredoxin [Pokkaliibacter plantistimulans]